SPTQGELDSITTNLCVAACQSEFASRPEVAIDCEQSEAFEEPTLIAAGSVAPVRRVPEARLDASEVFSTHALGCSIHDDCCELFPENVCPAKVLRPSPGEAMLERAEHARLLLSGSNTKLLIETPGDVFSMPLVGSMGYSL